MRESKPSNPKDVIGVSKAPLSYLPFPVIYEQGLGMMDGGLKYMRHNYRIVGVRASIYFDAAMRHLAAWWEGEDIDPDSGLHHVSKALSCLTVLRDSQIKGNCDDDRPPPAPEGWMQRMNDRARELQTHHPDPKPPCTRETTVEDLTPSQKEQIVESLVQRVAATPMEEGKPGYVPAYERMKEAVEKRGGIPERDLHD